VRDVRAGRSVQRDRSRVEGREGSGRRDRTLGTANVDNLAGSVAAACCLVLCRAGELKAGDFGKDSGDTIELHGSKLRDGFGQLTQPKRTYRVASALIKALQLRAGEPGI